MTAVATGPIFGDDLAPAELRDHVDQARENLASKELGTSRKDWISLRDHLEQAYQERAQFTAEV